VRGELSDEGHFSFHPADSGALCTTRQAHPILDRRERQ
jgi:hypothetical protein